MSEHTKGRLRYYSAPLRPQFPTIVHEIQTEDGVAVVRWAGFDGVDMPKKRIVANARRLVACWNACEGVSTEDLEAKRKPRAFPTKRALMKERDELLAALKHARDCGLLSPDPGSLARIDAALAKHTKAKGDV